MSGLLPRHREKIVKYETEVLASIIIEALALMPGALTAMTRDYPDVRVEMVQREPETALYETFARDFDLALSRFIEAIRTDRFYDNDGPRKACIAIFKLERDSPVGRHPHAP